MRGTTPPKHWYEIVTSREWRFWLFLHHNRLSSRVLSEACTAPTYQKTLRLKDVCRG
jgi:hypothetical protein